MIPVNRYIPTWEQLKQLASLRETVQKRIDETNDIFLNYGNIKFVEEIDERIKKIRAGKPTTKHINVGIYKLTDRFPCPSCLKPLGESTNYTCIECHAQVIPTRTINR